MSFPNRDIYLSKAEQHKIRKMLGPVKTISEYAGTAAKHLKEGKDWTTSLIEAAPWLKDIGETAGSAIPIVNVAVKLLEKWLQQTHPYELGAVACTLAYQTAADETIKKHWASAIGYNEAMKIDDRVAKRLRTLPPPEEADLSTFTRAGALQHPFIQRAGAILYDLIGIGGFESMPGEKILMDVDTGFLKNLDLLLSDKKTAAKFAPFKDWMELDGGRQLALAALQIHAKYQRDQFESEPLFKREPYALKHIYVNTECGKLTWRDIRGPRDGRQGGAQANSLSERCDPFSENYGRRHDLLNTVMGYITDQKFNEPIVIQGVAGAGKSSFTLRLCAELWEKGFHPIRIRLKRLRLTSSLTDALNHAIELADEDRVSELPFECPKDLFQGGELFSTPYGSNQSLSRYVLILDGWDELDLSDSKTFREKVGEMLREVRRHFLDPQRKCRVRVIVTGRPSLDVAESKFLNDDTPVLTMRPMRPEQLRKFVGDLKTALSAISPFVKVDNHNKWTPPDENILQEAIKKYEVAFNEWLPKYDEQDKIIEQGSTPKSGNLEVLGLPLLAYLTVRVMADVIKGDISLDQQKSVINEMVKTPTLLYKRLTDLTCEKAGKAAMDDRDDPDAIDRQAREVGLRLRDRLRRTAAAMSILGVEHISREEWSKRIPVDKDKSAERQTQTAEDHPLSKLMISFYFKSGQPEQGCEFAHKSFREYLFAECIVETLKDYGRGKDPEVYKRLPTRRHWRDFSETDGDSRYKFSRDLAELLAPQWLTPNVTDHLRSLIEIEISRTQEGSNLPSNQNLIVGLQTPVLSLDHWEFVRDGLADLWEWWADGAHLRPQMKFARGKRPDLEPPYANDLVRWAAPLSAEENEDLELENTTSMDAHLGEGLCELCALVHFFYAKQNGWNWNEKSKIDRTITSAERKFQNSIVTNEVYFLIFAPNGNKTEDLNDSFKRYIARINAAFGRPRGEFPRFAFLAGASLDGTNLSGVRLDVASLVGASLDRASLVGASLHYASLDYASLKGTIFYRASLDNASLVGASLVDARLIGASLDDASLDDANLKGAILYGASLDNSSLVGASLVGASLVGASLVGAKLSNAQGCTWEQIESAWIDEKTELPPEISQDQIQDKLRRQREILKDGDNLANSELFEDQETANN